jgi:hypothetical protein
LLRYFLKYLTNDGQLLQKPATYPLMLALATVDLDTITPKLESSFKSTILLVIRVIVAVIQPGLGPGPECSYILFIKSMTRCGER